MDYFTDEDIAALEQGGQGAGVVTLVELRCKSNIQRLTAGAGTFDDAQGNAWRGVGELIQIEGLDDARGTGAGQVTFTLSAVSPEIVPKIFEELDEVQDRLIVVYWQLIDADLQPHGSPISAWFGLMQPPKVDRSEVTDDQGSMATITLPCEWLLFGRARVPNGRYTDADQQRRFPGDRFCERTSINRDRTIAWPKA